MKSILFIFLFHCFMAGVPNKAANEKEINKQSKKALQIVKRNAAIMDSIHQLLVVYNEMPENNSATLVAMEKKGKVWNMSSAPISVGIGRKGFAAPNEKREGDKMSPTGFFCLGLLFCYEKEVDTRMPFIQTTKEDKWIDDPDSPDYNQYKRGVTPAKSFENLKINSDEYKFCMVIEYNMNPVVKGMGSAIFLHLSHGETPNPSSGCVVITQKDMEKLLKWMKPELKPAILMGNEKVLLEGLKR